MDGRTPIACVIDDAAGLLAYSDLLLDLDRPGSAELVREHVRGGDRGFSDEDVDGTGDGYGFGMRDENGRGTGAGFGDGFGYGNGDGTGFGDGDEYGDGMGGNDDSYYDYVTRHYTDFATGDRPRG